MTVAPGGGRSPDEMGPIGGVTSAQARMAAIGTRFQPTSTTTGVSDPFVGGPPTVGGRPVGFDPFGEEYLKAVEAARRTVSQQPAFGLSTVGAYRATATASTGSTGGRGRISVPAEVAQYGNGRIPTEALEPIGQGGHRLAAPAAQAWRDVVSAAAADGIELRITDSYRNYDQQVDLANRKGLYSEGGYAAVPGTSNHGWGLAVDADVTDPRTLEWLRANGPRFGFVEAVPREPWHWEYRPGQA